MTAYGAIRAALLPLATQNSWPLEPGIYDGPADYYITYNYADDIGADFGDDAPSCNLANMQVHFFMPQRDKSRKLNFQPYKKAIRNALHENGFTYPSVTVLSEPDADRQSDVYHIVFECDYIEDL